MAHEHAGPPPKAPWTKIFTAFKIALDIKKLLLAAVGILTMCVGWQVLGWTFHGMRKLPEWKLVEPKADDTSVDRKAIWSEFKSRRASWNLLHELAGSPSEVRHEDAADVSDSLEEFVLLDKWDQAYRRFGEGVILREEKKEITLDIPSMGANGRFKLATVGESEKALADLQKRQLTVGSLALTEVKEADKADKKLIHIDGKSFQVTEGKFEELKKYREGAQSDSQIAAAAMNNAQQGELKKFVEQLRNPKIKPAGRLRAWPWAEYRGGNPYLLVTDQIKAGSEPASTRPNALGWLVNEQAPILLEPVYKFLTPLAYMFDRRAGGWDRLYLILVMLWTLTVWGFFGGAICRIAAVQVARNERITLQEAIMFARERFLSYVIAPIFPLAFVAILIVVLMIFGWLQWTPWLGEIVAGLFWPIVLLIGFIMAIVLVGLVGWPLMNATISTEGSDSFDALSRSYSYVYQAPWQYLWYNFLAIAYGAALVFFVGFMASLMIFLGKWGVGSAWGLSNTDPEYDREPSYLFLYAPTSYGWRDLLLSDSRFTKVVTNDHQTTSTGRKLAHREFTPEYTKTISGMNRFGAGLVAIWVYLFFLLVLGFSYSYFWSASTIVYFLMRNHVDDTDMDEVHLEDDGLDDPFVKPATPAPTATPSPSKPGTLSLSVIDAPPAPPATSITSAPPPPPPAAPPAPAASTESPPSAPPATPPSDGVPPPPASDGH